MKQAAFSLAAGLLLSLSFTAAATTSYVDVSNPAPAAPYTNWVTAATNIQAAVDASTAGDEVVVTNGVYQTGGRLASGSSMTNQVVVDKPITVRSVNGPAVTVINGQLGGPGIRAVRCAYLTNGPVLSGFTLTNGWTSDNGGGVYCASSWGPHGPVVSVVTNCTLINNYAANDGGGAYDCTLNNCTLTRNTAGLLGGGAYSSTLNNCLVTTNFSYAYGGGANGCTMSNCTLIGNWARTRCGDAYSSWLVNCIVFYSTPSDQSSYQGWMYCCTTPPVSGPGTGNFTNVPLFVNQASGNFRLQSNSPCINAGLNAYAPGATDLDGNPRIVGGTVDVGAYECQSPALLNYYAWLQGHGLPTDASAVYADSDGDGLNNWQEWLAGTNPTNGASVLRLQQTTVLPAGVTLTWSSVTNRAYFVERATNLMPQPAFSFLETNIPGLPGTTSFTDTNPPPSGPAFYRVGVQP
jgi:hypothetical protein